MSPRKRTQKRRSAPSPRPQPVALQPPPEAPVAPVVGQLALDGEHDRPVSHVAELKTLARHRAALDSQLAAAIAAAHRDGLTYAAIGRALGITRQAVRQRALDA